jgi:hypothetical protein
MLSKIELEFLESPESFDADYRRVLRHRIKAKIRGLQSELSMLESAGFMSVKENLNGVTEFRNGEPSLNQTLNGSPGEIRTLVGGSKARYACPLHHRASIAWSDLVSFLLSGF